MIVIDKYDECYMISWYFEMFNILNIKLEPHNAPISHNTNNN